MRNVVAGAAVEPGLATGMDQLHANPVPLPFRGIVFERHFRVVERVGEHERAEHRHVARRRLLAAPFRPVEQLGKGRAQPMPDFLDRIELEPERLGQRLLRQPGIDPDAELAERELEQARIVPKRRDGRASAQAPAGRPFSTRTAAARSRRRCGWWRRRLLAARPRTSATAAPPFRPCRRRNRGSCRTAPGRSAPRRGRESRRGFTCGISSVPVSAARP